MLSAARNVALGKFFRPLSKRLQDNNFIRLTVDPAALGKSGDCRVIFGRDTALRDTLMRAWQDKDLVFVRSRSDGSFPAGALAVVSRLPNARYFFASAADANAVLRLVPRMKGNAYLVMHSPLGLFAERASLLSLRVKNLDGTPALDLVDFPSDLTDVTMWLSRPVEQHLLNSQPFQEIVFLEHPSIWEPAFDEVCDIIKQTYPDLPVQLISGALSLKGQGAKRQLKQPGTFAQSLIVTTDPVTTAYLTHCGFNAALLSQDKTVTPCSPLSADGIALINELANCCHYDLRQKKALRLVGFLSHPRGEFRHWPSLLERVNQHIPDPHDKLKLLTLAKGRKGDPSMANDLGLLMGDLVSSAEKRSKNSEAALREMATRLSKSGLTKSTVTTVKHKAAVDVGFAGATADAITVHAPSFLQDAKRLFKKKAINFGIRRFSSLGRHNLLAPAARYFSKYIARLGAERGFQFVMGMSGSVTNALEIASELERNPKGMDAATALICARLYLSAGATDRGMQVLNELGKGANPSHAAILSCLYRTGHIDEGIAWLERLSEDEKTSAGLSNIGTSLLINGYGIRKGYAFLSACDAASGPLPKGSQALLGRLAATVGDEIVAAEFLGNEVRLGTKNPDILQKWASVLRRTGKIGDVVESLQSIENANSARALLLLSYLLAEEGDLMGALTVAIKAFRLEPSSSTLVANTVLLASAGAADHALSDILRCHAETSAEASVTAATNFISRRDFDEAGKCLDIARKQGAEPLRLAQVELRLLQHEEKYEAAKNVVEKALALDPTRLNYVLMAAELAELRSDEVMRARHAEQAALISPNDHRVLEMLAKQRERKGDYPEAEDLATRAGHARLASGLRHDLRNNWRLFRLRATLDKPDEAADAFGNLVSGLHQILPPELPAWDGGDLKGKSILLLPRGGPGDELRTLQVVGRELENLGAQVNFVGDARLSQIFQSNFPDGEFIENPLAGSKLRAAEIAKVGLPRLQAGTVEVARRVGLYIRANTFERFDNVLFADDVMLRQILPRVFSNTEPEYAPLALDPATQERAKNILSSLPGKGPIVTISWRGSYFSPNRPSEGFLRIAELGELLQIPGIRFIDTHPNTSTEEHAEVLDRYGIALLRPEGLNYRDDLGVLGAIMCMVDANIVPPVTQRDLAAAVGAANIWSFDVIPGISEGWRVNQETQTDLWQPGIQHHTLRHFGSRKDVVAALAKRVKTLVK